MYTRYVHANITQLYVITCKQQGVVLHSEYYTFLFLFFVCLM